MADTSYASVLETRCLIDGAWLGEGETPVTDPSRGEVIAKVPHLGSEAATQAVDAASAALAAWGAAPVKARARILRAWHDLVMENREALAALLTAEQGKPLAEALGEIDYAASYIEYYAEEAKRILGEVIPAAAGNARAMVLRQPIGVVAVITPWNFPAAMITRKVAPALACGCTIVLKPAPETPLTALALARLAERAGVPAGVLNVITGDAPAIGDVFLSHPDVRLVGFTGSTAVGKHLMRGAADGMKRVALELGGNAPFIVFDDADLDAAVAGVIASKFRNMGQTCVCANRIYVQKGVHDAFVERLAAAVRALKVGDGREPGVQQGPLINMAAVKKVEAHVEDALAKGGTLVTGGKRHGLGGTFFEPTVVTGMRADMLAACSETFGPLAPVFAFETEAEVLAAANNSDAGLAAYFFTRDMSRSYRMLERLQFGMVGCNTGVLSSELAPFGGVKQSGNAREGSHHGIAEFTELKYAVIGGLEL
ncbi:NAD-dependent succinate-semialdehyde dehydrogenase [Stappia stellulata]|uniref:NAD-dependent succinate-semialdehyde dehydrogenase n=1 Tax=Stappia stellulata TaxID=71235 RepID=UPI001CD25653|nr:NAD-dependent succinate-semialdehyde dehydrogenase [Stappia stellulata]MCA1243435.1 NAD-dependent succinate-semialdehyde dehydrogenase [Stappia stellulata]